MKHYISSLGRMAAVEKQGYTSSVGTQNEITHIELQRISSELCRLGVLSKNVLNGKY
jgi:hypothetical protein